MHVSVHIQAQDADATVAGEDQGADEYGDDDNDDDLNDHNDNGDSSSEESIVNSDYIQQQQLQSEDQGTIDVSCISKHVLTSLRIEVQYQ